MSITLSMPPAIVQEIKYYAEAHGTNLSALTRSQYERLLKREAEVKGGAGARFKALVRELGVNRRGYKFNREELYARG